jgi:hypothetical protein
MLQLVIERSSAGPAAYRSAGLNDCQHHAASDEAKDAIGCHQGQGFEAWQVVWKRFFYKMVQRRNAMQYDAAASGFATSCPGTSAGTGSARDVRESRRGPGPVVSSS